jgi:HEAT repeat protein
VALTPEAVKTILEAEEPDYAAAEAAGPEAMSYLAALATGPDEWLAARAVSFAGRSKDPRAADVLRVAAQSPSPRVRTQAAHGARYLQSDEAAGVLTALMGDTDAGVRITAVKTTGAAFDRGSLPANLTGALSRLADGDPEPFIRESSKNVLP